MIRSSGWVFLSALLSACTLLPDTATHLQPATVAAAQTSIAPTCRAGESDHATGDTLDASSLRLLNWNVHKASVPGSLDDLRRLGANADLVLIQEAVIEPTLLDAAGPHQVFGLGFDGPGSASGVLTASRVAPVSGCSLQHIEPWLRVAKATTVTRYRLTNSVDSLLVINTHMINFSFGLSDMAGQLDAIGRIVAAHDGPVIVSGDFNTWREARSRLLRAQMQTAGLTAVAFNNDRRARFFGQPVDHIYTRGLELVTSDSEAVTTSDHNPMVATLRLVSGS